MRGWRGGDLILVKRRERGILDERRVWARVDVRVGIGSRFQIGSTSVF
jgi:hypothetical protein